MKTYGIVFVAFAAIAICAHPATASFFDIYALEDTYMQTNDASNTHNNMGLVCKEGSRERDDYLWFQFGTDEVTVAKLRLYQVQTATDAGNIHWLANVRESPVNYTEDNVTWNNHPNASGWPVLPLMPITANQVGWYEIDITTFYNANLGQTIIFTNWIQDSAGDAGLTFEDSEGSKGTAYYPRISGDTVPEPASLLMLVVGLIGLSRPGVLRRR
jgi:hypothetical protein